MSEPIVRTSYFTFGPDHEHSYKGQRVNGDSIVKITALDPRAVMFEHFGREWAFEYVGEDAGQEQIKKWRYRVIDVG